MSARWQLRSAAVLTALSIVLGALGSLAWTTGWPSWDRGGDIVRPGLVLAGQASFAVAATLLLRARRVSGRWPWVFLTGLLIALAALQLFVAGWSAGFDAADGVQAGPLARLALPALAVALAGFGAAIAALLLTLNGAQARWRPALLGLLGAGPAAYLFAVPLQAIWPPVALGIGLTVASARRSGAPAAAAASPTPHPPAGRLVRPLAGTALGIVVLVWGVGTWVGIVTTGTETATTAMGVAAGAAQLAAVPVFLSATMLLRSAGRGGASTRPLPLILTSVGLVAGTAVQLVGMSPDARALYLGSAISGAALGLWVASVTVRVFPGTLVRIFVAIGAIVAAEAVWFLLVPFTGGVALGAIAVAMLLTAPPPVARLSPASAAASP